MEFWGYSRPDGSVGVRNHVLILPATRNVNYICHRIALAVPGVTTFYTTGEYGRTGTAIRSSRPTRWQRRSRKAERGWKS